MGAILAYPALFAIPDQDSSLETLNSVEWLW
jgi:hypothetical protein